MLTKLAEKKECSGCMACIQVCSCGAINSVQDEKGFFYPVVEQSKCINCGMCNRVCSQLNFNDIKRGNVLEVYGVKHKDEAILKKSSSGAAFVALSEYMFTFKEAYIFGAKFDKDFNVIHDYVNNYNDIEIFKGSKYVQSNTKNSYKNAKNFLEQGAYVLYTGTPCQIAGLKTYLGKEYERLITVDLICHGVPSPKIWEDYVSFIEERYGKKIKKYNFRSRWKGIHASVEFEDRDFFEDANDVISYIDIYYHHYHHMRPCCFECKYANINRVSDITIGDFWGIEKNDNDLKNNLGVSVMIINSKKGLDAFEGIKDKVVYRKSTIDECMQAQLKEPVKALNSSESVRFWNAYNKKGYSALAKKYSRFGIKYRKQRMMKIMINKTKEVLRTYIKR